MFVFFWRLLYIFKKLCRVVKTLPPLIKLFSFNRKGFLQNLEKTKKPKNQNFLEKFWFQVKRCFFWFSLSFFVFFWFRFLKTKKKPWVFFGFLKEALVEERQKTKKTQGFFGFFMDSSYISSKHLTKKPKKTLSFFGFLPCFNLGFLQKTKKTQGFFWFLRI